MAQIKSTVYPTTPAGNFYEWQRAIHGFVPCVIKQKFDKNGVRKNDDTDEIEFRSHLQSMTKNMFGHG